MRFLLLLLFFPILSFAQERSISIEWDKVSGATSYEVEITGKNFNKKLTSNQTSISLSLSPGKYQTRFRSLDHRKVPGIWSSPENLSVSYNAPKVNYKTQNNNVKIQVDSKFNKTEIKSSSINESFTSSEINLRLPAGVHELKITSYKDQIPSESKTITVESVDEKLSQPNLYYFDNKINWQGIDNSKEYLVLLNQQEIRTTDTFIEINSDKAQNISVQAIGKSKYSPDSNVSTFKYDPKEEKYFSMPKKQIYLSYQIGEYNYKNIDISKNSRVGFSNTAGIGGVGFKYQAKFGLDLSYGMGGVIVNDTNYTFNEIKVGVNYLYEYSAKNKILLTLDQVSFEYYSFYSLTNTLLNSKENKSLTLIGLENHYYLNQRFLLHSKIKYNPSLINPEINLVYKITPSWYGAIGGAYKSYKLDTTTIENTYLNLNLTYGWN